MDAAKPATCRRSVLWAKVLLDADLAVLYGVTTSNLNKAVKGNRQRFPPDFMFQLTDVEVMALIFRSGGSSHQVALRCHPRTGGPRLPGPKQTGGNCFAGRSGCNPNLLYPLGNRPSCRLHPSLYQTRPANSSGEN